MGSMIYIPKVLVPEVTEMVAKYYEGEKIVKSLINDKIVPSPSHYNRNKENRLKSKQRLEEMKKLNETDEE